MEELSELSPGKETQVNTIEKGVMYGEQEKYLSKAMLCTAQSEGSKKSVQSVWEIQLPKL